MLTTHLLQKRCYVWCCLPKPIILGGFFSGDEGAQGQGPGALLGVHGNAAGSEPGHLATQDTASDLGTRSPTWGHGLTQTGVIMQKAPG